MSTAWGPLSPSSCCPMSMCDTLPSCAPHPARQHDVLTLMQGVTALLRCVTGEGTQGEAAELEAALPVAERRAGGLLPQKSTLERQVLMEREVVYLQMGTHVSKPSPGRWGTRVSEPISPSQWPQRFALGGVWEQNREIKGGVCQVLYVLTSTVLSDRASEGPVCVILVHIILASYHAGFMSFWLHGRRSANLRSRDAGRWEPVSFEARILM